MLNNFQLTAIVKEGRQLRLLRIPLHQALQATLAETWQVQYDSFVGEVHEIDFNAGYQPEEHERFCIHEYELPPWLVEETSQSVVDHDAINQNGDLIDLIKGIVAFARDDNDNELMLFQNFSRSHVIKPGVSLLLQGDTYRTSEQPGLSLGGKLSAVYQSVDTKLLFHNFRTVNSFLPLAQFYEEASEHQIRDVLEHDLLAPEDVDTLALNANQWMRKRFAMLRDSGVLDAYTADQIEGRSAGYDVDVQVADEQIVFPAEKAAAKKLLQFLNEELFRGAITETLYETNSKREAD